MSTNIIKIFDDIKNLKMIELNELVKLLEKEFNISATQNMMSSTSQANELKEEKTEFDIILKEVGSSKINVIKTIREIMGLGLKEAKDFVDNAPKTIKEKINQAEIDIIKDKLEKVGAVIEIK